MGVLWSIQDISNLKETQKQLELSNERYNTALNANDDGVWEWDIETNSVFVSDRWKLMHGFAVDDAIDLLDQWDKSIHPEDKTALGETFNSVLSGKLDKFTSEYRFKAKDGSYNWIMDRGVVVEKNDEGKPKRLVGTHHDISQKHQLKVELETERQRFMLAIEGTQDGLWDWNVKTDEAYMSDRFSTMLGYDVGDLPNSGQAFISLMHPDDIKKASEVIEEYFKQRRKTSYRNTFRMRTKDGNYKWISGRGKALFNEDGEPERFIGFNSDISEYKLLQKELENLNERMEIALLGNNDGVWDYNLLDRSVYFSPKWKEMLGYKDEELPNKIEIWEEFIHPDDVDAIWKGFADHINGTTEYFEGIHRLKHKNQSWVWILSRGKAVYDEEGKAIRMIGTHNDITEKKLLEQELEESYAMLYKLTENIPGAIYQYRLYPDGRATFPYISNGMKDLYEVFPPDLAKDATPAFNRIHKDDLEMIVSSIEESAKNMKDWNVEYRVDLPKKGIRWIEGHAKIEKLEDGSMLWHGFLNDITELKKKDELILVQSRHAAMGEMISMIAHQWRQPLSVISMDANNMLLDIALNEFSEKDAEKASQEILIQTQHLSKTIDDFRNFFKPDKDISQVHIEAILEDTYAIVADSLKNSNISYTTSFETDIKVQAYPRELMQVFVNIITNARDVILTKAIKDSFIHIRVYDNGDYVTTEICDNGMGIDESILGKIFDPYFTTKDELVGTGLGLYMSKMIIEDHLHGKIEVLNKSEGACFKVSLLKE